MYAMDMGGPNAKPATDNAKEIAAYAAFDLTFPNGVGGAHVIKYVVDNIITLNYIPTESPADTFRYVSMPVQYILDGAPTRAVGYISFQAQSSILVNVETPASVTTALHDINDKIAKEIVMIENIEHISETSLRMIASETVGRRSIVDNLELIHNEVPTNFTESARVLGLYVEIEPDDQHLLLVLPIRKEDPNDPNTTFGIGKLRTKLVRLPDDFDPTANKIPYEPGAIVLERPARDIDTLPFTDDQDKMIIEAFNILNIAGKFVVCVEADDTITAGVDGINTILHPDADRGLFYFNFGGDGGYSAAATMRAQVIAVDHRGITGILNAITRNKDSILETKALIETIKVITDKFTFNQANDIAASLSDGEAKHVATQVWNVSLASTAAFSVNSIIHAIRVMYGISAGDVTQDKEDSDIKYMDMFVPAMIVASFDLSDADGDPAGLNAVFKRGKNNV